MSLKQELHRLVDLLDEEDEDSALEYLRWLLTDEDTLTAEELAAVEEGEAEIARGEYMTLDRFVRSLDG
jgi:predicted transcriptional regulator